MWQGSFSPCCDLDLVLQALEAYLAHDAERRQQALSVKEKDTPFVFRSGERVAYRFHYITLAETYNTAEHTRWSLFGIPAIRRRRRPLFACPVPGFRVAVSHEDVYSIFGIPVKRKPVLR